MANDSPFVDPFAVALDTGNNIGVSAADARFALGGLTDPSPGATFGYQSGVFPGSMTNDANGDPVIADGRVSPGSSGLKSRIEPCNFVVARASLGPFFSALLSAWEVTHPTADSSNPRIDYVVLRVREPVTDGSVAKSATAVVLSGSPAANPTEALAASKLTSGDLVVGAVRVRAAANSMIPADYAEKRVFVTTRGGITPQSSADTAVGSYDGEYRDNGIGLQRWTQPRTRWETVASPAEWTEETPKLYYAGSSGQGAGQASLGGGSAFCRYILVGSILYFRYQFYGVRPVNLGSGAIYTMLPSGLLAAKAGDTWVTALLQTIPGGRWYPGLGRIPPNQGRVNPYFNLSATDNRIEPYRVANAPAAPGTGVPLIAADYPDPFFLNVAGTCEVQAA